MAGEVVLFESGSSKGRLGIQEARKLADKVISLDVKVNNQQ